MDTRFSASSLFAVYASLTAIVSLFQQFYSQFVPQPVRGYIASKIKQWFKDKPYSKNSFTLFVSQYEHDIGCSNVLYNACEAYISDQLRSRATRLCGSYQSLDVPISYRITQGDEYVETLEIDGFAIKLLWKFICRNSKGEIDDNGDRKFVELCFDMAYKNHVLDSHIPLVVVRYYEEIVKMKKDIYLYTFEDQSLSWRRVKFNHPFTFDALALDPEVKQGIISDLDKFIKRKEFYKRVGRAWKRGYLLYGPPGTGKSSLVAAMANHLKFDVYDLQLGAVQNDSMLRKLMLSTKNKSILVIEDVDCTMGMSRGYSRDYHEELDFDDSDSDEEFDYWCKRETERHNLGADSEISLSGLLNFIDGLWSSCGDERIIIFTTNKKESLDPALLRPGRMDMHINMSYLTMPGFKTLVHNYLGVTGEHPLFEEIEQLIATANVTPAQVAEELIRSEDSDVALSSVVKMLKKRVGQTRLKKKGISYEKTKKNQRRSTKKSCVFRLPKKM